MAAVDPAGFAEPHQSTVVEILRAVQQKLFTADEAKDYGFVDQVVRSATEVPTVGPLS